MDHDGLKYRFNWMTIGRRAAGASRYTALANSLTVTVQPSLPLCVDRRLAPADH